MNFEIPDSRSKDVEMLKAQIYEYVKTILAKNTLQKETGNTESAKQALDLSVFDCFSGNFGGSRDAHEIAAELHDSRLFTRNPVSL